MAGFRPTLLVAFVLVACLASMVAMPLSSQELTAAEKLYADLFKLAPADRQARIIGGNTLGERAANQDRRAVVPWPNCCASHRISKSSNDAVEINRNDALLGKQGDLV